MRVASRFRSAHKHRHIGLESRNVQELGLAGRPQWIP